LPPASSRFAVAHDTLAVQLTQLSGFGLEIESVEK
jgi:hypothetical protein